MGLFSSSTSNTQYTLPTGEVRNMNISGKDNTAKFRQAVMENEWNLAMAKVQNDWNIEQWNRENAYNAPTEQVKRLMEAGINPLLIDVGGNTAANSPSAAGATSAHADIDSGTNERLSKLQTMIDATSQAQASTMDALRYRNDVSRLRLETAKNEEELKAIRAGVRNTDVDTHVKGDVHAKTYENVDWYNHFLAQQHYQALSSRNVYERGDMENQVYKATMKDLKRLPRKQLQKLSEDIKSAQLSNDILGLDHKLKVDYGIDTSADFWNNLLMMGLKNPDSYNNVLKGLQSAVSKTLGHIKGRFF